MTLMRRMSKTITNMKNKRKMTNLKMTITTISLAMMTIRRSMIGIELITKQITIRVIHGIIKGGGIMIIINKVKKLKLNLKGSFRRSNSSFLARSRLEMISTVHSSLKETRTE
jgi:hypothetical protein